MYIVKKAFTLVEVLITLAVIGVVAAVVIPNLINNSNDQEYITGLKKAYAELSQATQLIMKDNGGTMVNAMGCGAYVASTRDVINCTGNVYAKYLSTSMICPTIDQSGTHMDIGCWDVKLFKTISGKKDTESGAAAYNYGFGIRTNSGMLFAIRLTETGNGTILVDINGNKGPDQWGKDSYFFTITSDGLKPAGYDKTFDEIANDCDVNVNPNGFGFYCAAKYLLK